jgi:hypothetical protein
MKIAFFHNCINSSNLFKNANSSLSIEEKEEHCAWKFVFIEECKKIALDYLKIPFEKIKDMSVDDNHLNYCRIALHRCTDIIEWVKSIFVSSDSIQIYRDIPLNLFKKCYWKFYSEHINLTIETTHQDLK